MIRRFATAVSLVVVPWCLAWLMRIWFATCRVTVHNGESFSRTHGQEKAIIASFWHYTIIFVFYFLRKYKATVMVSASDDGEYIARLAGHFGFDTVRGSSNKRGVGALKNLMRLVRSGESAAIVADGSQGPPVVAQPGAVLLASRTGAPLIPMAWSASSYITIPSWDRTAVPKPFSKIDYYYGEPIYVPGGLQGSEIEKYRMVLEKDLNTLYAAAWGQYNKLQH